MAQPTIDGTGHGKPVMAHGSDGSDHYEQFTDSEGVQRVDGADGDKLFAFESVVATYKSGTVSGASGYLDTDAVDTGKVWMITNVAVKDYDNTLTKVLFQVVHDGVAIGFHNVVRAIAAAEYVPWGGHVYLDAGDYLRVHFGGALAGDSVIIEYTGVQMNAP